MNTLRRILRNPLNLLPVLSLILIFPPPVFGQTSAFDIVGGDVLTVEGEEFTFERVLVETDGEQVFQEQAIWEGGVIARFGEIVLETERVMAIFDGAEISRLEAGPEVTVTGFGGRAMFHCADFVADLPTSASGRDTYSGTMSLVHGYYLATAQELGVEGSGEYEVNFTADVLTLEPDIAILDRPAISLGDLADPELSIESREISFQIGIPPDGGERAVLGAQAENVAVRLFGTRVNIIPFPVNRGFFSTRKPGWRTQLPMIGWESGEGFRWDQMILYDFADESVTDGPEIRFRLDAFPAARSYPEVIAGFELDEIFFDVRTGYRREEDEEGEPVPVRAEPEVILGFFRQQLGGSEFGVQGEGFWGHLRDMTVGTDLDRYGFRTLLDHRGVWVGEFRLTGGIEFSNIIYENGDNYRLLDGRLRLRYQHLPDWGASLTWQRALDWGTTPFRFELPQERHQLGLREQTRLSRRWGAGFDYLWDFEIDDFERQEWHLTYIFDSFQVSFGWDFEDHTARVQMDLPGSLR